MYWSFFSLLSVPFLSHVTLCLINFSSPPALSQFEMVGGVLWEYVKAKNEGRFLQRGFAIDLLLLNAIYPGWHHYDGLRLLWIQSLKFFVSLRWCEWIHLKADLWLQLQRNFFKVTFAQYQPSFLCRPMEMKRVR